jgi:hypothetical protein
MWLAISFLMTREARRDPAFLTEICRRFDKEFAELGFTQNHEYTDEMRVMARRLFQLMVTTTEILAKEADQAPAQLAFEGTPDLEPSGYFETNETPLPTRAETNVGEPSSARRNPD